MVVDGEVVARPDLDDVRVLIAVNDREPGVEANLLRQLLCTLNTLAHRASRAVAEGDDRDDVLLTIMNSLIDAGQQAGRLKPDILDRVIKKNRAKLLAQHAHRLPQPRRGWDVERLEDDLEARGLSF